MTPILLAELSPLFWPFFTLGVGIASVLGMIILLRMNAFLAMIIAAFIVSLMVGGNAGARIAQSRLNSVNRPVAVVLWSVVG